MMQFQVPVFANGRDESGGVKYVPGDTVYLLIAAGVPYFVGTAPSKWVKLNA